MNLLAEVVGDDVSPGATSGQPEVDGAVEASRPDEGGVEVVLAVGGADDQHVGGHDGRLAQLAAIGEVTVDQVDPGPGKALASGRAVEGLQLHQQLVDDAGYSLGPRAGAHAAPRGADGVDLLDETDSTALLAGVLAQLLEEGADLAVRLSVVHGLEGRSGHEQEGDVGLLGHGLGHEGLAGARRPLEQDTAPGRATHGVVEGLVGEEEIDGADHLGLDGVDAHQVLQADCRLARPDEDVRRAAGPEEGRSHDRSEHQHDEHEGEEATEPVRQVDRREDAVSARLADDDPAECERRHRDQAPQTGDAPALARPRHVRAAEDGVPHDPGHGLAGTGIGARSGRDHIGRSTHDRTPFIPRGCFQSRESHRY